MDTVDIIFAHHHENHVPGDRVAVDVETARVLVRGGRANYATKPDALDAEGDAGVEKTAKRRAKPDPDA